MYNFRILLVIIISIAMIGKIVTDNGIHMSVFDLKTVRAFSSFIFHIITILIRFAKKSDTNMYMLVAPVLKIATVL